MAGQGAARLQIPDTGAFQAFVDQVEAMRPKLPDKEFLRKPFPTHPLLVGLNRVAKEHQIAIDEVKQALSGLDRTLVFYQDTARAVPRSFTHAENLAKDQIDAAMITRAMDGVFEDPLLGSGVERRFQ